ncbi:class I SAM-dependent methyltransferase [Tsukamurella sp. 8F]|uniref:class I SAM-dependent methyltransferase n=1 Tax=Tsukamurella sp. 8F TaxID=3031961 RepID=UPI0023B9E47B|nr:class I SAM-dependent methyltransferase [Tsukamurella sp. 8F]MDF0586069.1 class I SAM-dependent methyltransferase [Tsukamurella sp. 8F]
MCESLPLTGERTVPGIPEENYWFRRHEIAYLAITERYAGKSLLEAGSGEGYGAAMLAGAGANVTALDYDEQAVAHVRAAYPQVRMLHGNLAELPLPDDAVDAVVNFQVIEHLWDQSQFLAEVARVLRPGGELAISTPNRVTFSPGRDTPLNPFHTRELNSDELAELLDDVGLTVTEKLGVFHGSRLCDLDARHGGSFIDAQIERSLAGEPWPDDLSRDVADVIAADFDIRADAPDSLDLLFYARKADG